MAGANPFASAEERGRQAALRGEPIESCPYFDHRTIRGGITFSRAWAKAWRRGWDAGCHDMKRSGARNRHDKRR